MKRRLRRARARARGNQTGLAKDPYVQSLLWGYALKVVTLLDRESHSKLHEYLYRILRAEDRKKICKKVLSLLEAGEVSELRDIKRYLSEAPYKENRFSSALEEMQMDYHGTYTEVLNIILGTIDEYQQKKIEKSDILERIAYLKETFKLSEIEAEVLVFLYLIKVDTDASELFSYDLNMDDVQKSSRLFCSFFEITSYDLQKILSKKSNLLKTGLVTYSRKSSLDISDLTGAYLSGVSDLNLLENFIKKANLEDSIEIGKHNISKEKIEDILSLLKAKHGLNILLHGKPGTGKSEFAKSLGRELGKDVFFINQSDEDGEECLDHRKAGVIAAMNMLDPETSIIVIDECDSIINSSYGFMGFSFSSDKDDTKAWLNDLLENTNQKIVWISNKVSGVDPSTRRRFSYSFEFQDLGFNQRLGVWKTLADKYNADFIDSNDLEALSRKFQVNAGGISLALKDVSGMTHLQNNDEKVVKLKNILNQHQSFVFGDHKKLNSLQDSYSLEAINSDASLEKVLVSTRKFLDYSEKEGLQEVSNMNFLLHGPSGTGKTEFAKYLAHFLGKELLVKRMSDLQSKWVGETEKNIADAFNEAEASSRILFLDEADSLFINRESAQSSWEVGQTNELLCQMENFKGILICATNHQTSMDVAVMRRFNHKIKFDYLTDSGKILLASSILKLSLNEEDQKRLIRISNLTPGDFKVVRQKNLFNEEVTTDEILSELEVEASYKRVAKPLGL